MFKSQILSLKTDYQWVAHNPDLNPLDCWLWETIKESVFADNPLTVEEIKYNAPSYVQQVTPEILRTLGAIIVKAVLNRVGSLIENIKYKEFVSKK